jgi:hypothetical protein
MKQKYTKKITKLIDSLILNTLFKLIYKIKYFFVWNFWNFNKKLLKYFISLVKKPLLNFGVKINDTISYLYRKKIIKSLNTFIQKTTFKIDGLKKNLFSKKSKVSNFNKLIITFISLLFFYLFYLSIPSLYDKSWVQGLIEERLLNEFRIKLSSSSEISYNILPSPHFLIKDSKIIIEHENKPVEISEIKKLKIFFYQNNFLKKENIDFKKIHIDKANFSLQGKDLVFLNKASDKQFSNKEIIINNSKVFLKDDDINTVAIIKIAKATFFYNDSKFQNSFIAKSEIFKVPFIFDLINDFEEKKKKEITIKSNKLKLNASNIFTKFSDEVIEGAASISILNFKTQSKYKLEKNLIFFESDETTVKNPNFNYKGKLFTQPFNLDLDINIKNYELSRLLNLDSIYAELIKNKLLFNKNISANTSISIASTKNSELFDSSLVNFNITNGTINFNKSKFINNKIGYLEISNSNLSYINNDLVLNVDLLIKIKNSNNLFSLLQTPKKSRSDIEDIRVNLDFNFLSNQIDVKRIKFSGVEKNDQSLKILNEFNDINDLNFHKTRRIFNKLLLAYSG